MICTEQERAALMAAVQRFGNDCIGYERSTRIFGPTAAESIRAQVHVEKSRERIRAMLAPDDAVVIPRALAERVSKDFSAYCKYLSHPTADAEALRAVLRGEATRDDR